MAMNGNGWAWIGNPYIHAWMDGWMHPMEVAGWREKEGKKGRREEGRTRRSSQARWEPISKPGDR